jgi:hypothetical protein
MGAKTRTWQDNERKRRMSRQKWKRKREKGDEENTEIWLVLSNERL